MKPVADFTIQGLPATINQLAYRHWRIRHKEAQRWKSLVYQLCLVNRINGLNLAKAQLELTRFSARECDFDNLASSFKHVLDGLKWAQVIVDDKPSVIGCPTFIWQKAKQKDGKIRIRIWDSSCHSDSTGIDEGNDHTPKP